MNRILPIIVLLLSVCLFLEAQEDPLNKDVALLFKQIKTRISNAEKNEIFQLTGFQATPDKKQFYLANNPDLEDFPFDVFVYPLDLNHDGIEEIAIVYGNMMISGNSGGLSFLYIKNDEGHYKQHLGFPGFLAFIELPNLEYPDVIIGGPGFQFPVYQWDGKTYSLYKKVSNTDFDTLTPVFLDEESKSYTDTIEE